MAVGPKMVPAGSLAAQDTTQKEEMGTLRYDEKGNRYVYVQADSTVNKGNVCGWLSSTSANARKVTPTYARAAAKHAAGVALYQISGGAFGYIQNEGTIYYVNSKSAVSVGNYLRWGSNLVATQMAGGTEHVVFGVALKTDSGSVIPLVKLHNCMA